MAPINVTKTFLPPLTDYVQLLETIWERGWITNHGEIVTRLENELKEYLGVKHLFLVTNGTLALQIAVKALELKGEIITTPFSYVATTSSIVWENCTPVFVDIDPETLTIEADRIEAAITDQTSAIMATHVYGNPCDIDKIASIAETSNIKIIYDGAHAFGVTYRDSSVFNFGDISTLSFHATKLFHTAEGGAVVCHDDEIARRVSYLRNFGHNGPENFWGLGINAKMSELHAAMGMCVLPSVNDIIAKRRQVSVWYDRYLFEAAGMSGSLVKPVLREQTGYNYAYYPVVFDSCKSMQNCLEKLNERDIFPRKYFFPSLNRLNYVVAPGMPVSEDIASRILCLPLAHDLLQQQVKTICDIILEYSVLGDGPTVD
jgi:dTDP-4-amino-4,6-dideoxygalactose transaminase